MPISFFLSPEALEQLQQVDVDSLVGGTVLGLVAGGSAAAVLISARGVKIENSALPILRLEVVLFEAKGTDDRTPDHEMKRELDAVLSDYFVRLAEAITSIGIKGNNLKFHAEAFAVNLSAQQKQVMLIDFGDAKLRFRLEDIRITYGSGRVTARGEAEGSGNWQLYCALLSLILIAPQSIESTMNIMNEPQDAPQKEFVCYLNSEILDSSHREHTIQALLIEGADDRDSIKNVQVCLDFLGIDVGGPDGIMGRKFIEGTEVLREKLGVSDALNYRALWKDPNFVALFVQHTVSEFNEQIEPVVRRPRRPPSASTTLKF